ncbi:hypothetical protein GQ53DRAFT_753451, partial [Thozetella sp. PMI_491]
MGCEARADFSFRRVTRGTTMLRERRGGKLTEEPKRCFVKRGASSKGDRGGWEGCEGAATLVPLALSTPTAAHKIKRAPGLALAVSVGLNARCTPQFSTRQGQGRCKPGNNQTSALQPCVLSLPSCRGGSLLLAGPRACRRDGDACITLEMDETRWPFPETLCRRRRCPKGSLSPPSM